MTRLLATDIHQEGGAWYVSVLVTSELDAHTALAAVREELCNDWSNWVEDPDIVQVFGFDLDPTQRITVLKEAYPYGTKGPVHKVDAIKLCRTMTSAGLKESKEYCERILHIN